MKDLYPWVCELTPDEVWRAVLEYSARKIGLPCDQKHTSIRVYSDDCQLAILRGERLHVQFFDGYPECCIKPLSEKLEEDAMAEKKRNAPGW